MIIITHRQPLLRLTSIRLLRAVLAVALLFPSGGALARNPFDEICNGVAGPALAEWVRYSIRDADQAGVNRIPTFIRNMIGTPELGGFVNLTYERVRYRVGRGHVASLQSSSTKLPFAREMRLPFGDRDAITLGDIIVFRDEAVANNPGLWVHELRHVEQYAAKGIDQFSQEYCQNKGNIEGDAEDRERNWANCYVNWGCGGPVSYNNVGYVGYTQNDNWAGYFMKGADGYWGEYDANAQLYGRWSEHYRSIDQIELRDDDRDLYVRFDFNAQEVLLTWPDRRYFSLHGKMRAVR